MGYLRIVTHSGILPRPLSPALAMRNIDQLLARPNVRISGEADGFWTLYRGTAGEHARGKDVPDAHLAALMRQHDVRRLYTRDRGFRRFEGIEVVDPF
jgi:toxin-antitoxin system PIN domain toxin